MSLHTVLFDSEKVVQVPTGTLLSEAARLAGLDIQQPCGGQGRCGRCVVQVMAGKVRRRSALRLTPEDVAMGYALACQSVVEGSVSVVIPPQERIERRLTTDRTVAEVTVPPDYDPHHHQTVRRLPLRLRPPSLEDQTDDWSRLQAALRRMLKRSEYRLSLRLLRRLGETLRRADWRVTAVVDLPRWECCPDAPPRLVDLLPGEVEAEEPLWGVAVDIGTTTVTLWLVDLISGRVRAQVAEYNGQIARGEDIISRIIYASKDNGGEELRQRVLDTINSLIDLACRQVSIRPEAIVKAAVAGNSTMMHLFLGLPAASIRLAPFVTTINDIPPLTAADVGLWLHPDATVDCLPGVASYVGADITAGVLAAGMDESDQLTLFLDIGTNGETVLGNAEWLVTCACSAGPAFEGAGVQDGMRATVGAIEEVWVNSHTYEPTYRVIGHVRPRGLCGSGLIALLAELFLTGVIDKAGHINLDLSTPRVRQGPQGPEYVVAWGTETAHGRDIVLTHVDIDNLLRAKAAIYAGFTVLADKVGVPLETVERVLIAGAFGKYINVEKAIQIGLLPDLPWERFQFLGNTAVQGAYRALLDRRAVGRIGDIASRMTYIELSADNRFYEAFTSALFLPHTDATRFPTVLTLQRSSV
ncbi:MAG: ASKHA domain-containing protein [Anaerolineae bacterium]|nr:ASKHA domain-containing protein [Caldilineales bacterium]MDW8269312.1 ASKHA domain-containing protein [Anaerolineae bacterium]